MNNIGEEIKGEKSKDIFKLSFGGKTSIDAKEYTNAINSTLNLLEESAKVLHPEAYLKLEIQAQEEGSFESILEAIVLFSQDIFTPENIGVASIIIDGMLQYLDIKQHLKGSPPKEIINSNNNTTIVTNTYDEKKTFILEIFKNFISNRHIQLFTINIFNNSQDRDYIKYEHNGIERKYLKRDYSNMKALIPDLNPDVKKESNVVSVELLLKKPDLLGNSRWQFVYVKNIEAEIEDKDFLDKLHRGEINIIAGIKIPCELLIEYELDENYNVIEKSERYTIKKVTGDIILPESKKRGKLF